MATAEKPDKSGHLARRGKRLELSDRQRLAILEIVKGATDEEAGKACGVRRQTVWDWRHHDARFIRALNIERNKLARQTMRLFQERMSELTNAALDEVRAAIRKGDITTAKWLLERVDIGSFAKKVFDREVNPPLLPEEMEAILDEMATARVDEFLRQKGVSALERLHLQPTLNGKELEMLRTEYDMDDDADKCP